jgi:hypothetical protein
VCKAKFKGLQSYLASSPELSSGMITLNERGAVWELTRLYSLNSSNLRVQEHNIWSPDEIGRKHHPRDAAEICRVPHKKLAYPILQTNKSTRRVIQAFYN